MRAVFISVYVVILVATASAAPQEGVTVHITGPSRLILGSVDSGTQLGAVLTAVNQNAEYTRGFLQTIKQSLVSLTSMLHQYLGGGPRIGGYLFNNTQYPDGSNVEEGSSGRWNVSNSFFGGNSFLGYFFNNTQYPDNSSVYGGYNSSVYGGYSRRWNSSNTYLGCEHKSFIYALDETRINEYGMNVTCKDGNWTVIQCPEYEGFFMLPESNQCFKIMPGHSMGSWKRAEKRCQAAGLVLPKPKHPVALRNYLFKHNPGDWPYWVGARGDGSNIVWKRDREVLDIGSWLLVPGNSIASSSHCLTLLVTPSALRNYPDSPYSSYSCSRSRPYTLCERIME